MRKKCIVRQSLKSGEDFLMACHPNNEEKTNNSNVDIKVRKLKY